MCDTVLGEQTIVENPIIVKTASTGPVHSSPRSNGSGSRTQEPKEIKKDACKFFLKGCCKYGFSGRNKVEESGGNHLEKFSHPVLCPKYMDHGNTPSGCSKGKDCDKAHVTLCLESLEHKVCSSSVEGKRCQYGYHLKGTKVVGKSGEASSEGSGGNPKTNSKSTKRKTPTETVEEGDDSDSTKEVMKTFLSL